MDIQDQSKPTTPSGHESDEVHICHRCGWPFPNSHPSSKHRRAHKKICGTIEGYTKLIDSKAIADNDDEHHFDDDDNENIPSPKIEKRISGSGTGGIAERSNKSEDDLFSDAVTEFSDTGISPGAECRFFDTTKLLDSPMDIKEVDDDSELFETPDGNHTKDGDKTEENEVNILHNSAETQVKLPYSHTKPSLPLVQDEVTEFVGSSVNKDQGEEAVYVLSVSNDIPLVDDAEMLLNNFKDHKTVYSNVPKGEKDVERSIIDTFEVKTAEANIEENQASENVVIEGVKVEETQPLEMSKTVKSTDNLSEAEVSHDTEEDREEVNREKFESDHKHAQEVIKKAEINHSVPVLNEVYTPEIVKEHQGGIEAKENLVDSLVANDSKDSDKVGISDSSKKIILEKDEESCDASGVVSENVVDEGDGKLMTSQHFGVDVSIDSSSRNSLDGNWGSVSVLSTASVDAENAYSSIKSEMLVDKSRLGKSDVFRNSALVKPNEDIVDHEASEMKAVTVQNSQPPKSEANISNETEGRKRNEEAIAKVTNWSTGEAKSSNPTQLSTMIQKDEAAEKASELGKSILVNQESSPPKYIDEGKKLRKKSKGRPSWLPFGCCSSVNVN